MSQKLYWVGFNLVKGIGAVRLRGLIDYYGRLEVAWNAPADSLRLAGLPQSIVENFLRCRHDVDLEKVWERIQKNKIHVVTWDDEDYPPRLKEIDNHPPVLYIRGEIVDEDRWAVAVVGTRRITSYGYSVAQEMGTFLAENGITVISGLARGVDSVAHEAALKANGRTIAVLGSGVDRVYPPEHRQLAEKIIQQGALVSDYAPGTPPDSVNFPPRNRIISGLSLATIVVEAGEKSGALITASFAANQGREVFAVPGSIHGPQSKGSNSLIQQGARPLLRKEDVLDVLKLEKYNEQRSARRVLPAADEFEQAVIQIIRDEPLHVDDIKARLGKPIELVSAALVVMELKGLVRQVGQMSYIAA